MNRKTTDLKSFRWALSLVLLLGLGLALTNPMAAEAAVCQASSSMPMSAIPSNLVTGNNVDIQVCIQNTSSTTPLPGSQVDAVLKGVTKVSLACADVNCASPAPGTLVFSAQAADGCVSHVAGVASCALDAGDVTGNTVAITLTGGGFAVPAATTVCFATFRAVATAPFTFNQTGTFNIRSNTASGDLTTNDADCDSPAAGNAGGGTTANFPGQCEVEVDKQVSCNNGTTFFDDSGLVTMNQDGEESGCFGWTAFDGMPAENVIVRYQAHNTGDLNLTGCTLTETNTALPGVVFPGVIGIDATTDFVPTTPTACTEPLDDIEPNRATVNCTCTFGDQTTDSATAFDQATFDCQTPGLNVSKNCRDSGSDAIADTVDVTVSNTGTAGLSNCVLTDVIDLNQPNPPNTCPSDASGADDQSQSLTPSMFALPVGGQPVMATGTINPALQAAACNTASVTCTIDNSGGKPITETDDDPCEFENCEVRLDKKITVDGVNFFDEEDFDPRLVDQAIGWTGENVQHVFVVENLGTSVVTCSLTDSKLGVVDASFMVAGMTTATIERNNECSASLEGDDTATLSCVCEGTGSQRGDTDTANLDCQAPGLNITKNCVETSDPNLFDFDIDVSNSGDATLINCVVGDGVAVGQCPASPPAPAVTETLFSNSFTLGPNSGLVDKSFPGQTVPATSCNVASVECNLDNGSGQPVLDPATDLPKVVSATDFETCEVPVEGECLARTPGFWGTHPHITALFLPLGNCGLTVNTTAAKTLVSSTEEMCSVGTDKDAKLNDATQADGTALPTTPQQIQLIRQCMAAELNAAANLTQDPPITECQFTAIGNASCTDVDVPLDCCTGLGTGTCVTGTFDVNALLAECCDTLCPSGTVGLDPSNCIGRLDAFNNSAEDISFGPFQSPGPANSDICKASKNNGFVNTGAGREYANGAVKNKK